MTHPTLGELLDHPIHPVCALGCQAHAAGEIVARYEQERGAARDQALAYAEDVKLLRAQVGDLQEQLGAAHVAIDQLRAERDDWQTAAGAEAALHNLTRAERDELRALLGNLALVDMADDGLCWCMGQTSGEHDRVCTEARRLTAQSPQRTQS